jgi:Ca2+-binding EF-hand superfamily protein
MDNDGDGRISVKEFKVGLRRLKCKNEKRWTFRLIRRLFDDCDKNGDGLISLREFTSMIKVWKSGAKLSDDVEISRPDSGDEGDEDIFHKERVIHDSELFKKVGFCGVKIHSLFQVSASLLDVVPTSGSANEDRIETVKSTVRKFFQRSDPDQRGVVSEERFRAFCRRSGLQEVLTTAEVRTLMERLRKRRGKLHGGVVLDYERFGESCRHFM